MGKFGGPHMPYQKSQEISGAGRHPTVLRLSHGKIGIILRCNPLGCRLVTGRYVLGLLYVENKPKSENWAILTPRSSYVVEKS